ncbi:MAG TPA: indole-3-glycerol-phosphate synthase [Clostridia bacterium]|nr:indole-3-glycerol-phosphate synthase [Clostridia bacterium]
MKTAALRAVLYRTEMELVMMDKKSLTACTDALWYKYRTGTIPVIPDIKCKSPGEGDLLSGRDPAEYAKMLVAAGAPVVSVVTEAKHYGGSAEMFRRIARSVNVPLLRKDFITSIEQLRESADMGASGVLLIASKLGRQTLLQLTEASTVMGLEPLIETHSRDEITFAAGMKPTFLGINNRDICRYEVDNGNIGNTELLASYAVPGALLLSESSISSTNDIRRAAAAGAHAVLVGTAILRARDPAVMYRTLSSVDAPGI